MLTHRHRLAILTAASTALLQPASYANPLGGVITSGQADIVTTAADRLDVNQSSAKAIINWASFNIGEGETTSFNQPNSSAVTLNRIQDANPSQIMGQLKANGTLMLVNPNGTFIGSTGAVNVANLVLSTADIADADFIAGKYAFSKAGNPNAKIIVNGSVTTNGGFTAIAGPDVTIGATGTIRASAGKIALAGGDVFTLDPVGDHLINFALPKGTTRSGTIGSKASVSQGGSLYADAGTVELTAKSASTLLDSAVNMSGYTQAYSTSVNNGIITIKADNVAIPGQLNARGIYEYGPGGFGSPGGIDHDGGKIVAEATKNLTFTGSARTDPNSLAAKGGTISMAGRTLNLGGSARTNVNNPGITLEGAGTTTFYAKGTFTINAPEALTIADSLVDGGTTYVMADKNIVGNSAIKGPRSSVPGKLVLADGDHNGNLNINLHQKITLVDGVIGVGPGLFIPRQALEGEGNRVTVHENASLQNGVDLVVPGGVVSAYYGNYGDVTVDQPDITLKGTNAGIAGNAPRRLESTISGLHILPTAQRAVVDGFTFDDFSTFGGIHVDAHGVKVTNNRFLSYGVYGENADDLTITGNRFGQIGNPYGGPDFQYFMVNANPAISLNNSNRATITGNDVVSNFSMGAVITDSDDVEMSDNTFNTLKGMNIRQSDNANIHDNIFTNHLSQRYPGWGIGFYLSHSANDQLTNNTFSNYDYDGAIINDATNLKITGGSFSTAGSSTPGLDIAASPNVLLQVPVTGYAPALDAHDGTTLATGSYSYPIE